MTERENRVLDILRKKECWTKYALERKSDNEFDIIIEGEQGIGNNKWPFSAWMPLSIISGVNWADNKIFRDGIRSWSRERLKSLYSDMDNEEIGTLYDRLMKIY